MKKRKKEKNMVLKERGKIIWWCRRVKCIGGCMVGGKENRKINDERIVQISDCRISKSLHIILFFIMDYRSVLYLSLLF